MSRIHTLAQIGVAAGSVLLCGSSPLRAEPGYGDPLTITTGTVYSVQTVAQLKNALSTANDRGTPGTLLLANGVYTLDTPALHITCARLVVRSRDGDRNAVVIRGPDEGPSASLHHVFLVSANHVTLADMTFGYCRYHGVQVQGESPHDVAGLHVHNCRIVNCNQQFIKGSSSPTDPVGATDGLIENCLFEFTDGWAYQYYTGGIDIHKGVNWIVRDNLFRSIRTAAGETRLAEHAIHFWNRCTTHPQDIVIERNRIVNCDRGIGFGLGGYAGGHNGGASVIRNNFVANDGEGGNTDVGIGLENADGVTVLNNTVFIPSYWAPIEHRFPGSSNVVFQNNLVDKAIRNRDAAPAARMSNNVVRAVESWFRDAGLGDLHLSAAAVEALDAGSPAAGFADDLDGDKRPALGAWDVGADEFDPAWARAGGASRVPFSGAYRPSREIHVATNGSDAGGEGSPQNPYATLAHAISFAAPGTAVVLAPGTYAGGTFITGLAGTAEQPIWIRGASPDARPLLSGGNEGLHLVRPRYVVVENLEVTGSNYNGINCDDGGDYADPRAAHHLVFRNLYIHDIGGDGNQDGLKLSGLNSYWVLDSRFERCGGSGSGSGIDHVGCHSGIVARCTFREMSANAVQCKGGSSDIHILQCRILDAGHRGVNIGGSTGPAFFRPPLSTVRTNYEARAIRVTANLFRGGIAPVAFVGCIDCVVANNTIVDPGEWHLRILQETTSTGTHAFYPSSHCAFMNNLVYFSRTTVKSPDVNVGPNTDPESFTFAHNLWYAHDTPGDSTPDLPGPELRGIAGHNPLLADPVSNDVAITLQSPAAAAGMPLEAVVSDLHGKPYLRPPGIGAREITGDSDRDSLPDAWELRHFEGTNRTNGGPHENADGDPHPDREEYAAGTDPTDPSSFFSVRGCALGRGDTAVLRWAGISNRAYSVYWATNLLISNAFSLVEAELPAVPPQNVYTHAVAQSIHSAFYRLGVHLLQEAD